MSRKLRRKKEDPVPRTVAFARWRTGGHYRVWHRVGEPGDTLCGYPVPAEAEQAKQSYDGLVCEYCDRVARQTMASEVFNTAVIHRKRKRKQPAPTQAEITAALATYTGPRTRLPDQPVPPRRRVLLGTDLWGAYELPPGIDLTEFE